MPIGHTGEPVKAGEADVAKDADHCNGCHGCCGCRGCRGCGCSDTAAVKPGADAQSARPAAMAPTVPVDTMTTAASLPALDLSTAPHNTPPQQHQTQRRLAPSPTNDKAVQPSRKACAPTATPTSAATQPTQPATTALTDTTPTATAPSALVLTPAPHNPALQHHQTQRRRSPSTANGKAKQPGRKVRTARHARSKRNMRRDQTVVRPKGELEQ